MDVTEFAGNYDRICCNVRQALSTYNNYKSNFPQSQIDESIHNLQKKQAKVNQELDSSESNILDNLGKWQSLNEWFTNIRQDNLQMKKKSEEEKYQLTKLRLAFASNASQLKSLEGDVIHCCRKLPDITESTEYLRLKSIQQKSQEQLNQRKQVLSEITADCELATSKYDSVVKENANLTEKNSEFQEQLAIFNNPESFQQIQDARKHNLLEQDWANKKQQILKEIEEGQAQLESYSGDKDQSYRNLMLESSKQDQMANRLQLKYAEAIQEVINENSISTTTIATAMKQLMIELERQQTLQLTKESNVTRNETRLLKNKADRQISKFKSEVGNSSRGLIQSLSKLQEQKASAASAPSIVHNPRNIKKKKRKAQKKKTNVTETPVVPPQPPRVYTLLELADMKLDEEKVKYLELLSSKFTPEISELQNFLERKIQIHQELLNAELSHIFDADKRQRDLLTANYTRMQQKILEKNIELSALHTNIATLDDMVRDYQNECDIYEKKNNEYKQKSLEIANTAKCIEIRKTVESLDLFLNSANDYINRINTKINETMESSNSNSIQKSTNLYDMHNHHLRRSNSTNNLQLSFTIGKKSCRTTTSALSTTVEEKKSSETPIDVNSIVCRTISMINEKSESLEEEMITEPEQINETETITNERDAKTEMQSDDDTCTSDIGMELLRKSTNTLFETTMKEEEDETETEITEKVEAIPVMPIEEHQIIENPTPKEIIVNEIKPEIPIPKDIKEADDQPINISEPTPAKSASQIDKSPRHYLHKVAPPTLIIQEDDNNLIPPAPLSQKEFTVEARLRPAHLVNSSIESDKPYSSFLTHKSFLSSSTIHKKEEKPDQHLIDASANVYQVISQNKVGEMQMKKGINKASRKNQTLRRGQKILLSVTPINSQENVKIGNDHVSNFDGPRIRNENRTAAIRTKERETKGARFMLYANDDNHEEKPIINNARINRFFGSDKKDMKAPSIRRKSVDNSAKEKPFKVHVSKKQSEKKQRAPSVRVFKKY